MRATRKRVVVLVCIVVGGMALAVVGLSKILPSLVLDIEHRSDRASADDLVARAWIPRCTSATATDISARFEADTGELWGTFKFNGSAFDCPTKVVEPSRGPRGPGLDWWPPDPFPPPSATILSIPEDRSFYAVVDSSGGRVFFWKLGAHTRPL